MSEKQAFLDAWEREAATTVKVLRAYPGGKETMKPHATCRSAQELAWTFAFEGVAAAQAIQGEFKFPVAGHGRRSGARLQENGGYGPESGRPGAEFDDQVLYGTQADGRRAPAGLPLADAERHDPPSRAVLRLPPHGGRQSSVDLRPFQG